MNDINIWPWAIAAFALLGLVFKLLGVVILGWVLHPRSAPRVGAPGWHCSCHCSMVG